MSSPALVCWKCGASLDGEPLPLARLAECRSCHADLHVCRQCEFYDPGVANSCREPIAEEVQDKEHANFCGYFRSRPDAYVGAGAAAAQDAKRRLEALFGGGGTQEVGGTEVSTETERARRQLEALFGHHED